jgi:hypothetical protein
MTLSNRFLLGAGLMAAAGKAEGGGAKGDDKKTPPPPTGAAMGAASTGPKDEPAKDETKADAPDETPGPQVIKKINPKDVMGTKIRELPIPSDLYTVIGRAHNLRDGESQFGPWTSLRGEFEAVRLSDGETFISAECFVPGPAGDLLVQQVRKFITEEIPVTDEQAKKAGRTYKVTGEYVEMALVISTKASTRDAGQPYEFVVRPIVPVQKADALAALRERMQKTLPRLAAPKAPAAAA